MVRRDSFRFCTGVWQLHRRGRAAADGRGGDEQSRDEQAHTSRQPQTSRRRTPRPPPTSAVRSVIFSGVPEDGQRHQTRHGGQQPFATRAALGACHAAALLRHRRQRGVVLRQLRLRRHVAAA